MRSVGKFFFFLSLLSFEPYLSISVEGKMRHNTVRHELEMTDDSGHHRDESMLKEVDEQHERQKMF